MAETAQDIHEDSADSGEDDDSEEGRYETDNSSEEASVNDLFKHLKDRLTTEQQTANGTGDAQWQQLLTLLDMVHQTYNRIQKS